MANGLRGVKKKLVRKTQQLYTVLIFAQLLIKQKLKNIKHEIYFNELVLNELLNISQQ
jgi:hypothetical protein